MTILVAEQPEDRGSIAGTCSRSWYCPKRVDWLWDPPSRLFSGYPDSLQGVMRTEHEIDYFPPSSAQIISGATPPLILYAFIACTWTTLGFPLLRKQRTWIQNCNVENAQTPIRIVPAYLCPEDHQIPNQDKLSTAEQARNHCAPTADDKHIQRVLVHKFVQTSNEEMMIRQLLIFVSDNFFFFAIWQLFIHIKSRLKLGNACYHSVQNLLSSSLLSKNLKIKIYIKI